MTLFNVRLGIWLPNPSKATADELRLARPRNSLMALIDEMLGETTDDSQAIYLSDGGHFENLGLYEMFRRRCSSILVVDAGADEACSLFDLGNAIRKSEIDLGISVQCANRCTSTRGAGSTEKASRIPPPWALLSARSTTAAAIPAG